MWVIPRTGYTGSHSMAAGRNEQAETYRLAPNKPRAPVGEAYGDPIVVDASRSRAEAGDLEPGKEGREFVLLLDKRFLLPDEPERPRPGSRPSPVIRPSAFIPCVTEKQVPDPGGVASVKVPA
jgi:hypothetical protein